MPIKRKPHNEPTTLVEARLHQHRAHRLIARLLAYADTLPDGPDLLPVSNALHAPTLLWELSAARARLIRAGRTGRRPPGAARRAPSAKPGDNPAGQVPDEQAQAPGWDPATGLPMG